MDLKCIAEHTIDLSRITRDSKVIDIGCRAFGWAKAMLEYIDYIACIDADPDIEQPPGDKIEFINCAVCGPEERKHEFGTFIKYGNGTGNYLDDGRQKPRHHTKVYVPLVTINELTARLGYVDLIKMDIEGSEIDVIKSLVSPPATQLTIEWHLHTGKTRHIDIKACFYHLEDLGYEKVFEDYSRKHGLGENYWDTLFILK